MGGSGNLPVGPGIWGFIAFFVLAVALWFLVRNMNGRLRRMAYRDGDETDQLHPGDPGDADGEDGARSEGRPADGGPDGTAPRP